MKRLSRGIITAIIEEFGPEEFLKRISNPIWFQSLGCVLAFDWNSSGLTTTVMGALKEGVRGLENNLGLFICGGKGKTSRKTPDQIQNWGEFLGLSLSSINKLTYASRISAKVDSSCLQDGFQIYHHNLIFIKSGKWCIVQQGMSPEIKKARRYHWLSSGVRDFTEEPHSGIISGTKVKPLNLTAKESSKNKVISASIVKEEPKNFLKDFKTILSRPDNTLIREQKFGGITAMELRNKEFFWHPVVEEKFDLKRLEKTIFLANEQQPTKFEELLAIRGIGPKTIRALSLVSEIIYGAKPSYKDPARYSFAHGGKDQTPYPVDRKIYDKTIEALERGIKRSKISNREKKAAQKRLMKNFALSTTAPPTTLPRSAQASR